MAALCLLAANQRGGAALLPSGLVALPASLTSLRLPLHFIPRQAKTLNHLAKSGNEKLKMLLQSVLHILETFTGRSTSDRQFTVISFIS